MTRAATRETLWIATTCGVLAAVGGDAQRPVSADPFAFFSPTVTLSTGDRSRLDRGEVVVHVIPSGDKQVALFAAVRLSANPDTLTTWTRAIAQFKRSTFVTAVGRFSAPPQVADVDALRLDADDLASLRRCRAGDCDLKLTAAEIDALRHAIDAAPADWESAAQREFRRLVLARVVTVQRDGLRGLSPLADRRPPVRPADSADALLSSSAYLTAHAPALVEGLRRFPAVPVPSAESFFYWSQERFGTGKPVTMATKVDIVRPTQASAPAVLVVAQEILATHYRNGSLGISAVVTDPATSAHYFVYVNRSELDLLSGLLGGVKRAILEGRLRRQVGDVVDGVRRRLEGPGPGG